MQRSEEDAYCCMMLRQLLPLVLCALTSAFTLRMSAIAVRKATDEDFAKLQIKSWATWGCTVSKFPWTYSDTETCYVIKGKVVVTPAKGEPVSIEQGDIATFPEGMSCTWDVKEDLLKHYKFDY